MLSRCQLVLTVVHSTSPPTLTSRPLLYLSHLISSLPIPFLSYTPREKADLERTERFYTQGAAYFAIQSTQPQTLGYSLADSPAGLLAWIYDKLSQATDKYPWEDDEGMNHFIGFVQSHLLNHLVVLTWISLHFFSRGGPTAALRTYYEVVHSYPTGTNVLKTREQTNIPVGHSYFPTEIIRLPRRFVSFYRHAENTLNCRMLCADGIIPPGGSRRHISCLNPSMIVEGILLPMRSLLSLSTI